MSLFAIFLAKATCFPCLSFPKKSKKYGVFFIICIIHIFIGTLPRPGEGNKSPAQRTLEYSRQLRELRQGRWRGCFYRTTCGHNMTDIMFSNNPIYNNISSVIATYNWLSIKVWRGSKYQAYTSDSDALWTRISPPPPPPWSRCCHLVRFVNLEMKKPG